MSDYIQILYIVVGLAAIVFLMIKHVVKKALREDGFMSEAVVTEFGNEKTLTAKGKNGETLVARVKTVPSSLAVQVKHAYVPIADVEYYWLQFADGSRVQAKSV